MVSQSRKKQVIKSLYIISICSVLAASILILLAVLKQKFARATYLLPNGTLHVTGTLGVFKSSYFPCSECNQPGKILNDIPTVNYWPLFPAQNKFGGIFQNFGLGVSDFTDCNHYMQQSIDNVSAFASNTVDSTLGNEMINTYVRLGLNYMFDGFNFNIPGIGNLTMLGIYNSMLSKNRQDKGLFFHLIEQIGYDLTNISATDQAKIQLSIQNYPIVAPFVKVVKNKCFSLNATHCAFNIAKDIFYIKEKDDSTLGNAFDFINNELNLTTAQLSQYVGQIVNTANLTIIQSYLDGNLELILSRTISSKNVPKLVDGIMIYLYNKLGDLLNLLERINLNQMLMSIIGQLAAGCATAGGNFSSSGSSCVVSQFTNSNGTVNYTLASLPLGNKFIFNLLPMFGGGAGTYKDGLIGLLNYIIQAQGELKKMLSDLGISAGNLENIFSLLPTLKGVLSTCNKPTASAQICFANNLPFVLFKGLWPDMSVTKPLVNATVEQCELNQESIDIFEKAQTQVIVVCVLFWVAFVLYFGLVIMEFAAAKFTKVNFYKWSPNIPGILLIVGGIMLIVALIQVGKAPAFANISSGCIDTEGVLCQAVYTAKNWIYAGLALAFLVGVLFSPLITIFVLKQQRTETKSKKIEEHDVNVEEHEKKDSSPKTSA